jgi:hypothetical protein
MPRRATHCVRRKRLTSDNANHPAAVPEHRASDVRLRAAQCETTLMFNMQFYPRRLPARYAGIVMPLVLSVLMSLIVSAISTLKSIGIDAAFFTTWPVAWFLSWLVAFPALLAVMPLVRRIVACLCEPARS